MNSPKWGPVTPIDPVGVANQSISNFQCIDYNDDSKCALNEGRCPPNSVGQSVVCCDEKLSSNEYSKEVGTLPIYIDGSYSSCFHNLTKDIHADMERIINDPTLNYKDSTVSYDTRLQRYQTQQERLAEKIGQSDLGRRCAQLEDEGKADSIASCLDEICPELGYRLIDNQYEFCRASGNLIIPQDTVPCRTCIANSVDKVDAPPESLTNNEQFNLAMARVNRKINLLQAQIRGQQMMAQWSPQLSNGDYFDRILPLNPPGRGAYGGFIMAGYLTRDDQTDMMLPLYGRRISPNRYQYYTINKIQPQIQIPINNQNGHELQSGDLIKVANYQTPLRVVLYGPDFGSYAPY